MKAETKETIVSPLPQAVIIFGPTFDYLSPGRFIYTGIIYFLHILDIKLVGKHSLK